MCDRSAPSSALSTTDFERHGFKQNRPEFIEPELAESWSWDEDHTRLTFNLRGASTGKTASRSPPPTSNAPAARRNLEDGAGRRSRSNVCADALAAGFLLLLAVAGSVNLRYGSTEAVH